MLNPAGCERWLHDKWAPFRTQGEWFGGGRGLFEMVVGYMEPRVVKDHPVQDHARLGGEDAQGLEAGLA